MVNPFHTFSGSGDDENYDNDGTIGRGGSGADVNINIDPLDDIEDTFTDSAAAVGDGRGGGAGGCGGGVDYDPLNYFPRAIHTDREYSLPIKKLDWPQSIVISKMVCLFLLQNFFPFCSLL
jgi:hypothetical protein